MFAEHKAAHHDASPSSTADAAAVEDWFGGSEQQLWFHFIQSESAEAFCRAWLALQCRALPGTVAGMVLLGEADSGPYVPAAVWPRPGTSVEHLSGAAERALRERRGVVGEAGRPRENDVAGTSRCSQLAYPLEVAGLLHGVVVLETSVSPGADLQALLRRLHWGICWLEVLFHRQSSQRVGLREQRAFLVLELLAATVAEKRYQAAAMALVTELATRLDCERVSLGRVRDEHIRVEAISHSATFGREMNLTQLLASAMEEAVDQAAPVRFPHADAERQRIVRAHEALAQEQGAASLCTVPLHGDDGFVAALTLERPRGKPFNDEEIELCELLGELSWTVLALKKADERWLATKALLAAKGQFVKLFGPGHVLSKTIGLLTLLVVGLLAVATGDYRVSGDTRLEGAVLRAVTAPFDAFVATAAHRAGDTVAKGAVLATLDDRDLRVESIGLATEQAQYLRERREAVASHDRARVRILSARIEQVQAQLDLVAERLSRTQLLAPFDGLVVSGDLSQSLGAPLQRGEVVFEIAPLDAYRLVLQVDERDIGDVQPEQTGTLVLSAMPGEALSFRVERVNPVTTATEGRNFFEVEATLDELPPGVRPGMEGVGKIQIGERRLVWVWTRTFVHWLRLFAWSVIP